MRRIKNEDIFSGKKCLSVENCCYYILAMARNAA
jgi:hypothetical protein